MRAARKGARNLVLMPWLLAFAKEANDNGRLTVGGKPADPEDISSKIPGCKPREVAVCCIHLVEIEILARDDDGAYRFTNWDKRQGAGEKFSRSGKESYVYYALDGRGLCKIGLSNNPWARVHEMRTSHPNIRLAAVERGARDVERARHEQFKGGRTEREWFRLTQELTAFIESIKATPKAGRSNYVAPTVDIAVDGTEIEIEQEIEQEQEEEAEYVTAAAPVTGGRDLLLDVLGPSQRKAMRASLAVWTQGYDLPNDAPKRPPTDLELDRACREVASSIEAGRISVRVVRGFLGQVMRGESVTNRKHSTSDFMNGAEQEIDRAL